MRYNLEHRPKCEKPKSTDDYGRRTIEWFEGFEKELRKQIKELERFINAWREGWKIGYSERKRRMHIKR